MYDELFTYIQSVILIYPGTGCDEEIQICKQKNRPYYLQHRGASDFFLMTQETRYATAEDALAVFVDGFLSRNKVKGPITVLAHTGDVFLRPEKIKQLLDDKGVKYELKTF
jgi:hypothetical protein